MKLLKNTMLFLIATATTAFAGSLFDGIPVKLSDLPRPTQTVAGSSAPAVYPLEFRSIDGSGNNPIDPLRGAAGTPLLRLMVPSYPDGVGAPTGVGQKSAREISNLVVAQEHDVSSAAHTSDYLWQWGQFLDHDIDLTPAVSPIELFNIVVPTGDPQFDPLGTGTQTIECDRSLYQMIDGVRQQMNANTAFIDASQVYGSNVPRAMELRMLDGTGRLKTSAGDLLPYNLNGFPNGPSTDPNFFLAGDVRSNEQVGLTAMHTLFMREHNYWAGIIAQSTRGVDEDTIYNHARAIVGAEVQIITYREFLPLLLGPNALPPYTGYQPTVDPGISNVFSTAAYRVGHTMLSDTLRRLDANFQSIGDLSLAASFFNPVEISIPGIEPYLRGLSRQVDQEVDCYLVDGVRNFLFGPPGAGGFDLASLNIQRGRDHGLPRYNAARQAMGMAPKATFAEVTSDLELQAKLASAYATPDDMDLWVGGLAEDHVNGGLVGELFFAILRDQFTRLRDGDRFWYQTYLPESLAQKLEAQTLSDIIKRNTPIGRGLRSDVFTFGNSR